MITATANSVSMGDVADRVLNLRASLSRKKGLERTPITVLVVDDEPKFAMVVKNKLEEDNNIEATIESNPNRALDKIRAKEIECVVSDYAMPGMNGIQLLTEVRKEYPKLPFIIYTGKGSEQIAEKAFSAGATDYVIKTVGDDEEPFTALEQRILNAVRNWRDAEWRGKSIRRQYLAILLAIISIIVSIAALVL